MNVLCIGDIHIKPTNIHLVDLLQNQVVTHIDTYNINLVILLGDLLDTFERIHTQALNKAYEFIEELRKRCKVYIIVGNHDYINNQQFLTSNHWMNALKEWNGVHVVDYIVQLNQCVFVPYVPTGRFVEALDTISDWKSKRYIFAHQEFRNAKMGAITSIHGDQWDLNWPVVISGHIHDRQEPQKNIIYIGASIQNSFGDQSTPTLLLINTDIDTFTWINVDLPKKKTLYKTIEEIKEMDISSVNLSNTDSIRVVVKCDYEEFKNFSKTTKFEELCKDPKYKIIHKPEECSTRLKEQPDLNIDSFENLLYKNILKEKNETLYCIYSKIVYNVEIDKDSILII
jgi:DNA repair exonuclease SbcCD nuclease subunit